MTLRWTPEAADDLVRLHAFVAGRDPEAATRTLLALRNAVRQLPANPRLGASLAGFSPRDVRRLVVGDHELRYELAGEAIHILRFFHGREDR